MTLIERELDGLVKEIETKEIGTVQKLAGRNQKHH